MKKILLIITIIIAYKVGYLQCKRNFTQTQTNRVNFLYGEGDLGEKINYYLQTGDTSINY